jgi:hypothetical protein
MSDRDDGKRSSRQPQVDWQQSLTPVPVAAMSQSIAARAVHLLAVKMLRMLNTPGGRIMDLLMNRHPYDARTAELPLDVLPAVGVFVLAYDARRPTVSEGGRIDALPTGDDPYQENLPAGTPSFLIIMLADYLMRMVIRRMMIINTVATYGDDDDGDELRGLQTSLDTIRRRRQVLDQMLALPWEAFASAPEPLNVVATVFKAALVKSHAEHTQLYTTLDARAEALSRSREEAAAEKQGGEMVEKVLSFNRERIGSRPPSARGDAAALRQRAEHRQRAVERAREQQTSTPPPETATNPEPPSEVPTPGSTDKDDAQS